MTLPYRGWTLPQFSAFGEATDVTGVHLIGTSIQAIMSGIGGLFDSKSATKLLTELQEYGRTRTGNDPSDAD